MLRLTRLAAVALILSAGPCLADATHNWYVRYSGGTNTDTGESWDHAWATIQKAWDRINTIMVTNSISVTNVFNIYLEQTTSSQAFAGASTAGDWWGYSTGGSKKGTVNHFGGYDPASGTAVGTTRVVNDAGDNGGFIPGLVIADLNNVTLSGIAGGTALRVGKTYNYGNDLNVKLNHVLFDGCSTALAWDCAYANRKVALDGKYNGFYDYSTLTNVMNLGSITDNMTLTARRPTDDGMVDSDGVHLLPGSPAANVYPLASGDPLEDIDGGPRPAGAKADVGADEIAMPVSFLFIVRGEPTQKEPAP
jgi:hypothetical protein